MPPSATPAVARASLLKTLMLLTLAAVAMALWYLTSYSLRGNGEVRWFAAAPGCEPGLAACEASLESGRLSFSIESDGEIRALEPLPMVVALEGVAAERVTVDFVGRGMEMGLHRFPLERGDDGLYRGLGQVTLCTRDVMPWRAEVVVETSQGRQGSRFDFDVERHRP